MEKKIVTFDLDGTLLTMDYQAEENYFREVFSDEDPEIVGDFIESIPDELMIYEGKFETYDVAKLNFFLKKRTELPFNKKIIETWIDVVGYGEDTVSEGAFETLQYLKEKKYKLVLLTNWFQRTQEVRLIRSGLDKYFDAFIYGESCLKPHHIAYMMASGNTYNKNCTFVGDNYLNDYLWPWWYGFDAYLYDPNNEDIHDFDHKIKQLTKLKELL